MDHWSSRKSQRWRQTWCCSFMVLPSNLENPSMAHSKTHPSKSDTLSKPCFSVPNSPQSAKSGLGRVGRINPHQILSLGRVSHLDSDSNLKSIQDFGVDHSATVDSPQLQPSLESSGSNCRMKGTFDVRLNLRGKNGEGMILELNSKVLSANFEVFSRLITDYENGLSSSISPGPKLCRIEVPEL